MPSRWSPSVNILAHFVFSVPYLSFRRSPIGTGLTEIRGNVEMEPCDWLLANEEVSRLSGDCGGVIRLGLLHSEWEREPGFGEKNKGGGGVGALNMTDILNFAA